MLSDPHSITHFIRFNFRILSLFCVQLPAKIGIGEDAYSKEVFESKTVKAPLD